MGALHGGGRSGAILQGASEIRAGEIFLFYLFDVAESVDMQAIPGLIGGPTVAARLQPKQATRAYVQYEKPPLSFDGEAVGVSDVEGFRPRFCLYDYGIISVALTQPFSGSWPELVSLGQTLIESDEFEREAERLCRTIVDRLRPALVGYRGAYLSEDYLVYLVNEFERPQSADELLVAHGNDIATMLRGEQQPLSEQEKTKILHHHLSYLVDDLVVPTWNPGALARHRRGGAGHHDRRAHLRAVSSDRHLVAIHRAAYSDL